MSTNPRKNKMILRHLEVNDKGTGVTLYGDDPDFHVYAPPQAALLEIGSEISYEPYGVNLGYYPDGDSYSAYYDKRRNP